MKIHELVKNFSKHIEADEDIDAYIETIEENANLDIGLSENNEYIILYIFQSFTIRSNNLPQILDVQVKKLITDTNES